MEDPQSEEQDEFPYDGDLANRSKARDAIAKALGRSPSRLLGDELIRELAAKLEEQRKKDRKIITPGRLSLALRRVVVMAADYTRGSTITGNGAVSDSEKSSAPSAVLPPNATTAKRARKKLSSAKELIDQLEKALNSDEIAAFDTPSKEVLSLLRSELNRLTASVRVAPGLRRGRPPLLYLVQELHRVLHRLTGSWLRFREEDERGDRFIADALNRVCKPLIGTEFSDEDLAKTIETAIRSPKNLQKSGASRAPLNARNGF